MSRLQYYRYKKNKAIIMALLDQGRITALEACAGLDTLDLVFGVNKAKIALYASF